MSKVLTLSFNVHSFKEPISVLEDQKRKMLFYCGHVYTFDFFCAADFYYSALEIIISN